MKIVRRASAVALLMLHGVLLVACATQSTHSKASGRARVGRVSNGDAAFSEGDFTAAVSAYEDEVAGIDSVEEDPSLVLRLALARAAGDHGGRDLARARDLLRQLEKAGALRGEAAALLSILDELRVAEEAEVVARHHLAILQSDHQTQADELLVCEEDAVSLHLSLEECQWSVSDLQRRLREAEEQARRLAGELDQLKQIDLEYRD